MRQPPAGPGRRLLAFLLDYLVIAAYIVVLTLVSLLSQRAGVPLGSLFADPIRADLLAFLLLVLPVILYFAISESSPRQATWGKARMRLRVTDRTGERLPFPRALLRSALKFLPWQIAHTSLFHIPGWPVNVVAFPAASMYGFVVVWVLVLAWLGFLLFHPGRRTPYDFAAGSVVMDANSAGQTG